MRRFSTMDGRLSRSMPFLPLTYLRVQNGSNGRGRSPHRRSWFGGVPTRLIGLSPSHRTPQRLILCTPHGSYEKVTRSSSEVELSRSVVFRSREDLRDLRAGRRAASYEDVYRGTHTSCLDSSRFSESGVSVNCSHTDDGSYAGVDEDAVSQSSFGSSSAFCEITCDSELDRPDSDVISVPGSERSRYTAHHRSSAHTPSKRHQAAASHNGDQSDASSVKSGEFFHSTPTKTGSPLSLSIFPADDDLQFFGKDSPSSSQPNSPRLQQKTSKKHKANKSPPQSPDTRETVRESVKKSREQFFSSLQDCPRLDDLSSGDSIQAWVSTGHRPGVASWVSDLPSTLQQQQEDQQQADTKALPTTLTTGARVSVSERVKALETGHSPPSSPPPTRTEGAGAEGIERAKTAELAEPGSSGAALPPASQCTPHIGRFLAGGGGSEIGNFGPETTHATTDAAVSSKVSQGEKERNEAKTSSTTTAADADTTGERLWHIDDDGEKASDTGVGRVNSSSPDGLDNVDTVAVVTQLEEVKRVTADQREADGRGVDGDYSSGTRSTSEIAGLFTGDSKTNSQQSDLGKGAQGSTERKVDEKTCDRQAARENENLTECAAPLYEKNRSECDSHPPSSSSTTALEFPQQAVTPPSQLSVNMSGGQGRDSAAQREHGVYSTQPEACFVDRREQYEPGVRIREIRRTHTRHIHRTTVQQIVTTHRTLGPGENTRQSVTNPFANGPGALAESGGGVTDRTVSTLVREEDSSDSIEETRCVTQQHLADSPLVTGRGGEGFSVASQSAHGVTTTQRQVSQSDRQLLYSHTVTDRGDSAMAYSPAGNVSLLDSLQEQLSRLASDDSTLNASVGSDGGTWGYRDHAEASLPHSEQSRTDPDQREIDSKSRVFGTGSVFITLDKNGEETSTQVQSSPWQQSFSSEDGDGRDRETGRYALWGKIAWQRPASSSSELDESDGNYSSISTTESSQQALTHTASESDFPPSEGPEDYDNVSSFSDFVSGLHGQSTSDQPRHADVIMASLLRSPVIQETILEADDESESADEANTTVSSFKSSLHFTVSDTQCQASEQRVHCPVVAPTSTHVGQIQQAESHGAHLQSTPTTRPPSSVPQIRLWGTDQHVTVWSSPESVTNTVSHVHPLQELSDRLSSISSLHDTSDRMSAVSDMSYEADNLSHTLDELDASLARMSSCSSPVPSDISEGSVYSSVGFAEVKHSSDISTAPRTKLSTSKSQVRRNLASAFKPAKEADWVIEKSELFERLLADIERHTRPQSLVMFDEMCQLETQQRGGDATDLCDDLYRAFTRDDMEKRQNHICPIIDDQIMPVFRFKRFLKKHHSSKIKGKSRFRIVNKLDRLCETSPGGTTSLPDSPEFARSRQKPYERGASLSSRLPSEVFTEDGDVRKSFSDSAYSTMSSVSSRTWADFDSVSSSHGDIGSVTVDSSVEGDKLRALSDVFEQLDVCEGEIDQALLNRLRAGHYAADVSTARRHKTHH